MAKSKHRAHSVMNVKPGQQTVQHANPWARAVNNIYVTRKENLVEAMAENSHDCKSSLEINSKTAQQKLTFRDKVMMVIVFAPLLQGKLTLTEKMLCHVERQHSCVFWSF